MENEIDLRKYIMILKKRLPLILIIVFLTTLASVIYSFLFVENVYEAYTTIYAGRQVDAQGQQAYQDIIMGQTLVKDYREIAKSKLVCWKVKAELEKENIKNTSVLNSLNLSDTEFSKKIIVSLKNDTRIIEIRVSDNDPEACVIIADKVAAVFKETAVQLLRLENVQIVDKADIPQSPVKPDKKMNVSIGFLLGFMVAFGLAFLLEFLDNTIKTPDDVTKHLGLTVLGVIPKFDLIDKKKVEQGKGL